MRLAIGGASNRECTGRYHGPMHLETDRLTIRSFTISDLPEFAAIQADPEVMRYIGGVQSFDASHKQLLEIIQLDESCGLARLAVEYKAEPGIIGYCGFKPAGDFIDLGYQYGRKAWGKGVGLEAAIAVRAFGLLDLGIKNMEAGGAIDNVASVRIMQKLGFANCEQLMFDGTPAIRFFD